MTATTAASRIPSFALRLAPDEASRLASEMRATVLMMPTVSTGNIPQMVIDMLLTTLGDTVERIGAIYSPLVLDYCGPNPLGRADGHLASSTEIYLCRERKLTIVQHRAPIIYRHAIEYYNEFFRWANDVGFARVVALSSANAGFRVDALISGAVTLRAAGFVCLRVRPLLPAGCFCFALHLRIPRIATYIPPPLLPPHRHRQQLSKMVASAKSNKKIFSNRKLVLKFGKAGTDGIVDTAGFAAFLQSRIKVDDRINNLGKRVVVKHENRKEVSVNAQVRFSKHYFKYLIKKYLSNIMLRDWIRVVASSKSSFELRYFNTSQNA